jgi:hypothetical protein
MCESRGRCFFWFRLTDRARITDIGSSWVVNGYLNKRFKQEKKKYKHYTVTSLVSPSVSTLERLMKTLEDLPFSDVLEELNLHRKTSNLNPPFEAASAYAQSCSIQVSYGANAR